MTIAGLECSLELLSFFDLDKVVGIPEIQFGQDPVWPRSSLAKIQFGEDPGFAHLFESFWD